MENQPFFEDYLGDAEKADTPVELFSALLRAANRHGYDRAIFSLVTPHPDLQEGADFGLIHNYPEDWLKYYTEKELRRIDPVNVYGVSQVSTFRWVDIERNMELKKLQKACLGQGRDAGLHNGICTPLRGPKEQLAGVAFASSEKKDAVDENIAMIDAYAQHFYARFSVLARRKVTAENIILTKKQIEVLKLVSIGKTNPEIMLIMGISLSAVNFHLQNIFEKLDVNNRVSAATKAIRFGLLNT